MSEKSKGPAEKNSTTIAASIGAGPTPPTVVGVDEVVGVDDGDAGNGLRVPRDGDLAYAELLEDLETGEGLGAKPAVERVMVALADVGELEEEGWARVLGEDPGDENNELALLPGEGEVGDKVEGRGAACVRAPSLVGRREMMVQRTASGRALMRSRPAGGT
ncbi:hypothetical protein TRIUR3_21280 [Triticum urartu]|uniref:DUF834 domain-containing protein n=1 Tax=Triticum urartu TaxID=4572 RepID=M8A3B7_TRIUA|nr:hypothetical protein TRIUR3_21280 [Triticum urartu]